MISVLIKTLLAPKPVRLQLRLLLVKNCMQLSKSQREDTQLIIRSQISELMLMSLQLTKILMKLKNLPEKNWTCNNSKKCQTIQSITMFLTKNLVSIKTFKPLKFQLISLKNNLGINGKTLRQKLRLRSKETTQFQILVQILISKPQRKTWRTLRTNWENGRYLKLRRI